MGHHPCQKELTPPVCSWLWPASSLGVVTIVITHPGPPRGAWDMQGALTRSLLSML